MSLPREELVKHIADQLNMLAAIVKTRSRASLTDANHILETIAKRFFNTLRGWDLVNLNAIHANYPAADLGDRERRIAIQVTNAEGSKKIEHTASKAVECHLGKDFDRLIIFFLLAKKPGFPKKFVQPPDGPKIDTQDIADLLKQMQEMDDLDALACAAKVLDEEMGKLGEPGLGPKFDISRILKYAPAELIGREAELDLLRGAWTGNQKSQIANQKSPCRPHVLTFVALGGEGKTALVAKWAADLAAQDWPGCDAAFAWSFYSQGTREQQAASSDLFLKEALTFFGDEADKAFAASPAGAFEKGQRLARLIGQRRSLLILDGVEPLQYAPTAPTPGELKDSGLAALLKGLAAASHGLCIVTTRYSLPDLNAFMGKTVHEEKLARLSRKAGVDLLTRLGVKGSELRTIPLKDSDPDSPKVNEFEKLVEDVKGHALTLTLLGSYLHDAHAGDIRKRDLVKLEEADTEEQGGHAFRVMAAYERAFEAEGDKGKRALAILRLLGLFDRPMTADCFAALLEPPPITGLTDPLVGPTEAQLNLAVTRLESAKLITTHADDSAIRQSQIANRKSVDSHPLVREYFGKQLREKNPKAWKEAHRRLYEHLCASTPDKPQPTLEDLQPLYQAVAHGCQAGLQQQAYESVYFRRVRRGNENYSVHKLGAFGSNLSAVSCFFEQPWNRVDGSLAAAKADVLLSQAGFFLRSLGRLNEALEPMRASVKLFAEDEDWKRAAAQTSNLSELELTLGEVARAVGDAEQSVTYADRSGDAFQRMSKRTTHADALHQAGRRAEAQMRFREAEHRQQEIQPDYPLLYSLRGFLYCDLLLTNAERAAWRLILRAEVGSQKSELIKECRAVSQRAAQTLKWVTTQNWLLDIALDHLTLGRAALYEAILTNGSQATSHESLDAAVSGLRRAAHNEFIARGLLTLAWLRYLTGKRSGPSTSSGQGPESAQEDLDEAWEIAERGPMRLHMADICLHRARLFRDKAALAEAVKLIDKCGYHRRDAELADAQQAAKNW